MQFRQEMAGGDKIFERQIARRDDPGIDLETVPHPDRADIAALQRFEQAVLHRGRQAVDTRIIAASNLPLKDLVTTGHFLPELHEALSQTAVVLPPLRGRLGDLPALARHFLARIGEQPGLRPLGITDGAQALLGAYDWPGNVRQLQAVLFRAAVFCDGDALTAEDFPQLSSMLGGGEGPALSAVQEGVGVMLYTADGNLRPLEEIEADVIRLAIGHYRGRMTEVARRLGIGRSTLYRKLGELGMGEGPSENLKSA